MLQRLFAVGVLGVTLCASADKEQPGLGRALALDRSRQQGVWVTNFGGFVPTHEITIEFWQKVSAHANQFIFLLNSGVSNHCIGVYGPTRVGAVHWYFGDWQGEGSLHYWPPRPIIGTWQHFAFVASHRGGYMKIYRNGLEEASKPGVTPYVPTNATLMIGANPQPDGRWDGLIDEFRVWNVARTQREIQSHQRHVLTGAETNLVAYWRFDEGSGNVAVDATGHGHTGALINHPRWVESPVPPISGASLSFNDAGQTNQYLEIPPGTWFGPEFTIEAWVYERSYQFSSCLLDFGNGQGGDNLVAFLSFEITGLPVLGGYNGAAGTALQRSSVWSSKKIPLETWTHVAFSRETNGLGHIYLDGARVGSGALYAPRAVCRSNNFIGRSNWPIRAGVDAILQEVRLWQIARSGEEIRHDMGRVLTGFEPGLTAYWRLNEGEGDRAADATGQGQGATLVNGPLWLPASAPLAQLPEAHSLGFCGLSGRRVNAYGSVFANGFPVTAWFEWGRDMRYGQATVPVELGEIGRGLAVTNVLAGLAPDSAYHFRIVCTNLMGRVEGEDLTLRTPRALFLGLAPDQWRYGGAIMGLGVLMGVVVVRSFYVRRYRHKLELLRQQEALERERGRIARDLHDDLGAAVTQIKLLGELVERDAAQPEHTARHGHRIVQTSRDLAQRMDELVWLVNPQKDHLENLVSYLAAYSEESLGVTGIRCRFDFPDEIPDLHLSGTVRHRLFLAFKEALHNVVKHAQATEVQIRLRLRPEEMVLLLEDNGKGFEPGQPKSRIRNGAGGNGLGSIGARLSEIGGACTIESRPGAGTKVELRVRLN